MALPIPYSYREYKGNGVATDFSVPFPYLLRAHVHVYLNDKELIEGTDYNWTSDVEIQLTTAPQDKVAATPPAKDTPAELLTVMRQTPEDDQIVQWRDGSYIIAEDLNESDLQWLYLLQEHHDGLVRFQYNLGALPGGGGGLGGGIGGGSPGAATQYWNRLARHLDAAKGTGNEVAQTVDTEDQKTPDATGLVSDGWTTGDKHVATTGAISERLDVIVSDVKPADPPITEYRQSGKSWIDSGALRSAYWEPSAGAWVSLGDAGVPGPPGPASTIKGSLPAGSWTPPANPLPGDMWLAQGTITGFPGGDLAAGHAAQWTGLGWIDVGRLQGPAGPPGAAGSISPATGTTLGGVIVGSGLTVQPDGTLSTTNAGTVTAVTGTAPIASTGGATPDISIAAATSTAAGSMSAADKAKLDGITAGAAPYTLPVATASVLGGVKAGGSNISITADGVISASIAGAVEYQGIADLTAAPTGGATAPVTGHLYVSSAAGTIDAGWTGIGGTTAAIGEMVIWDGAKWDIVGIGASSGVTSVTGSTPIVVTGTAAAPVVGVNDATATAKGVVQLADAAAITAGTSTTLVTTVAQLTAAAAVYASNAETKAGTVANKSVTPASGKATYMPLDLSTLPALP
jgi:hypothetical protein